MLNGITSTQLATDAHSISTVRLGTRHLSQQHASSIAHDPEQRDVGRRHRSAAPVCCGTRCCIPVPVPVKRHRGEPGLRYRIERFLVNSATKHTGGTCHSDQWSSCRSCAGELERRYVCVSASPPTNPEIPHTIHIHRPHSHHVAATTRGGSMNFNISAFWRSVCETHARKKQLTITLATSSWIHWPNSLIGGAVAAAA